MMNRHQIDLVQTSFAVVFAPEGTAPDILYDRLFALSPSLRGLFASDLSPQKTKLVSALSQALNMLDDPLTLRAQMTRLGSRHRHYGVAPETYDLIGAALLHTVKSRLGPDVENAWTAAYAHIAANMLAGQRSAS